MIALADVVRESAAGTVRAFKREGIEVEVVDPRTLRPLDEDLIFESVRKTNRLVIVQEGWEEQLQHIAAYYERLKEV